MFLSDSLYENITRLEKHFSGCGDYVKRKFPMGDKCSTNVYIAYIDGLTDRTLIEFNVINRLMFHIKDNISYTGAPADVFRTIIDGGITTADMQEVQSMDEVEAAILSGDTALLVDGYSRGIIISTKGWPNRGIQSAETEVVVQGSKEAFTEGLRSNTALIRRRIRDPKLKIKQIKAGARSVTDIAMVYLADLVRPAVLQEAADKLTHIDIDAIMDSGCVEQLIEKDWLSPFPQAQVTERPDKAASAVLEGRIVIIVDNSPFVLIIPATLNTFFQASEDYYQRWEIMSFVRFLRFVAGFLTMSLPALYLSIAVYHPSMIPTLLMQKMAGARQSVPFPAVVEILLMDFAFELLREAGIRLPGPIGSTIGIVGGLIIGQAAVEAGLVSPIVVIIMALTGICGFAIPQPSFVTGLRLTKYMLLFFSSILGLFGFWLGFLLMLIHLADLKSFGIPYLFPFVSGGANDYGDLKDSIFRLPLFAMKKPPIFANPHSGREKK